MDRQFNSLLKKAGFLAGALFLGWVAQAQAQGTTTTDSTHQQYGYHHGWGHRPGGDSLSKAYGFHHGWGNDSTHRGFGRDGWAYRGDRDGFRGDREGFRSGGEGFRGHEGFRHEGFRGGRGHFGHGGNGIHYTPEQRKQLMAINKEYRQKSEDLFKQDNITLKEYKAGLVVLQKEKKEKMAALLTPQQKAEVAARKSRMDENRKVMEAARLERLQLRLNLTDDQVAKIKAGNESLHNQVKAIHENDNLLPQQKREQMKALLAKRTETYKSVLTPEQYSQFEKMQGGFRG